MVRILPANLFHFISFPGNFPLQYTAITSIRYTHTYRWNQYPLTLYSIAIRRETSQFSRCSWKFSKIGHKNVEFNKSTASKPYMLDVWVFPTTVVRKTRDTAISSHHIFAKRHVPQGCLKAHGNSTFKNGTAK
jgi:hypothetical protein